MKKQTVDHIAILNSYVKDVLSGDMPACKWIRLACERHKNDLARAKTKDWPYKFDTDKAMFGWVYKVTGKRRFRKIRLYLARKNGKSSLSAPIGLYMLAADGEPGAEVYSGATTEKQAWEVFGPARQMALKTRKPPAAAGVHIQADNCQ